MLTWLLAFSFLPAATALMLTCHPSNFTCPGSPVSCECQGSLIRLIWTITFSATGSSVLDDPQGIEFTADDSIGSSSSNNGFIGVLSNISGSGFMSTLTSKLHFNFSASITVKCRDNFEGRGTLSLQGAGILLSAHVFYVYRIQRVVYYVRVHAR